MANAELQPAPVGEGALRVLRAVEAQPLGSAADIAAVQDRDTSGVSKWLKGLGGAGLVESKALGCAHRLVDRYYLTEAGQDKLGVAGATWHHPGTLYRLLERQTSVERLYPAAAAVKGLGQLQEFQWLDGVSFDAAVRYERGWVALFWAGLLRSESRLNELLEDFGKDLQALAVMDPSPRPSQLLFVAVDRWEVELIRRVVRRFGMEDWVRLWCVSDDSWHGTEDLRPSRGWVYQPPYRRNNTPRAWERKVKNSLWSAPRGQEAARILTAVAQWPGSTIRILKAGVGEKDQDTRVQNQCMRLLDRRLLDRELDGVNYRYWLTPTGMTLLARLDRTSKDLAWQRIQMARWPLTPEERKAQNIDDFRPHEFGVLDVVEYFIAAGLPVAAGWRDTESFGAEGGISPDTLVCLQESPYGAGWHYLEYERSARSPTTIAGKLRGFDSALRSNDWPVLAVSFNGLAEGHFHQVGRDKNIRMLTTTIARLGQHGPLGNYDCWSQYGQRASIG